MEQKKNTMAILAIIFAGVSVIFLPPIFGLAAFVLGLIATIQKQKLGVLSLVLGIVLPVVGMIIGALVVSAALSK